MEFPLRHDKFHEPSDIVAAVEADTLELTYDNSTEDKVQSSRTTLDNLLEAGEKIYGSSTGFGALVKNRSHSDHETQAKNLISHLTVGTGDPFEVNITKAAIIIRAITLSRGKSGIELETFEKYCELASSELIPSVPRTGSLGASGDLIPMANVIQAFMGNGKQLVDDKTVSVSNFFRKTNYSPLFPDARDALALVNGVPFCTAIGCYSLSRIRSLLETAIELSSWLYSSLGCSREAIDSRLNSLKGHPEQELIAEELRNKIAGKEQIDASRPLQEVYSIRGVPQILSGLLKSLGHVRTAVKEELNGVDDNPVIVQEDEPTALHGANFMGQCIAFGYDYLNNALAQTSNLIERQLSIILDPDYNNEKGLMLANNAGANSGLAGAQINATAILSEIRNNVGGYGSGSLTTNGKNQDIVPMTMDSARHLYEQTNRCARIEAIMAIALSQYDYLHSNAQNELDNSPDWLSKIEPIENDRPLRDDVSETANEILRKAELSISLTD